MGGFKQTEIGTIPEDWELVRLEQVASKLKAGGTPKTTVRSYWDGDTPLVKVEDVVNSNMYLEKTNLFITQDGLNNSSAYLLPPNSIVFTMYGTAGEVAITKVPVAPTQNVLGIIGSEKADNEFLYYALKFSKTRALELIVDRTIFKHFTLAKAKNLLIALPPISEQQNIAHILSKIQSAIETQEKIIKTTTELKKALMQKLFTEGLNGERQKETEIGLMLESWEVKRISEVYDFTRKPKGLVLDKIKQVPFIPMELIPDDNLFVRDFELKKIENLSSGTYIEKGDLLIAKITPSFENGKQAIVDFEQQYGFATTEVIPIKEKEKISCKQYLFYYLLKGNVRGLLAGKMEGSTGRQRLSKTVLGETLIPFPSYKEQIEIANTFIKIDDKIQFAKTKKFILQSLFNSMLHHLMTGQIRVKDLRFS